MSQCRKENNFVQDCPIFIKSFTCLVTIHRHRKVFKSGPGEVSAFAKHDNHSWTSFSSQPNLSFFCWKSTPAPAGTPVPGPMIMPWSVIILNLRSVPNSGKSHQNDLSDEPKFICFYPFHQHIFGAPVVLRMLPKTIWHPTLIYRENDWSHCWFGYSPIGW